MTETRCRTCHFLKVNPDKDGVRRIRKGGAYLCTYQVPWPTLPESISPQEARRLPRPTYMEPDQGTTCAKWKERE